MQYNWKHKHYVIKRLFSLRHVDRTHKKIWCYYI